MKIEEQETFTRRVLRDMSEAVLVLDRHGYIVYINRPAASMLELDPKLEPGTKRFALSQEDGANDRFCECILDAIYRKKRPHVGRVPYRSPSGKHYAVRMSASYLGSDDPDDSQIVITITDETKEEQLQQTINDSSRTFSTFLFGFCIWIIIYALWEYLGRPIAADFMTHGVELLSLVMLAFIMAQTSLSWRDLGVLSDDTGKTAKTALIVAVCAVAFLFALKGVIRIFAPNSFSPESPFFDIRRFGLRQLLYVFTAGLQEFLARGVMQGNLKRIMPGKHRAAGAIILSSLIFAALHIHFGFLFMLGAAILAGLEGVLYEKQQSIVGVWIVHWAFGVTGTLLCLIDH